MGSPAFAVILVEVSHKLLEFKFVESGEDGGKDDIVNIGMGDDAVSRLLSSLELLIEALSHESLSVLLDSPTVPELLPPSSTLLFAMRKCLNDS